MEIEDYFFEYSEENGHSQVLVLVIYDITDNRKRIRFAKLLQGYGIRVQKSAFEARLTQRKYEKLMREISAFASNEDSIRVYRIQGTSQITSFGSYKEFPEEEDIIIL